MIQQLIGFAFDEVITNLSDSYFTLGLLIVSITQKGRDFKHKRPSQNPLTDPT